MAEKASKPPTIDDRRGEWSTIKVTNVPLDTPRSRLESAFTDFGIVKRCFVMKGREGTSSTIGYVTFAQPEDANEVAKLDDLQIDDHVLKLQIAPNTKLKDRGKSNQQEASDGSGAANARKGPHAHRTNPRKARLIIRNLSFKANEEKMREYFGKFGGLEEVNILKKENGKMVGCAFIQYKNPNHATKAIKEANAKPFLGRPVAVDWAVPKEMFKGAADTEVKDEVKDEPVEVKEEPRDESGDVKIEKTDIKDEIKEEPMEAKTEESSSAEESDGDNNEEKDSDGENDDSDEEEMESKKPRKSHDLATGHDVNENKTVFIKNLSFETDEEDLRDMMEEIFGPVYFAKLVMDKVMNHPRGTGFVKFRNVEDAAKCVEVSEGKDGIFLDKRQLTICLAMKKDDVQSAVAERKKKEAKDTRNLYLAREGMIREGTKAAEGVSTTDLEKRKQLEKHKKMMLKNLNMFVSKTRLCIRNLPPSYDDKKFKQLMVKSSNKNARITECKVIKDMKNFENGKPVSKQFGFVSYKRHEDALSALRGLNNNPETFGPDKRPIVDFAIENRKALLARQKREEKSKLKNPNFKGNKNEESESKANPGKSQSEDTSATEHRSDFAGTIADPKIKTLPKHTGPKVRHNKPKISRKDLRKQEQDRKNPKKRKLHNRDTGAETSSGATSSQNPQAGGDRPQPPAKKKKKNAPKKMSKNQRKDEKENKAFESLVSQYKNKFVSNQQVVKKWFDK